MAVAGYLVACGLFVAAALAEIDLAQRFGHAPAMDYTMAIGAAVVWGWAGIAGRLIVPSSRVGTLMVILAGLSFVNALGVLGLPADFPGRSWIHAGHLLSFWLMAALVVHLLVTHPHGIARTAGQRRLVHASYALAVTIALAILLAWAPASPACGRSCVTSPISINDDLDLGLAVSAAGALCALAMSVVVMAYLTLQYAPVIATASQRGTCPLAAGGLHPRNLRVHLRHPGRLGRGLSVVASGSGHLARRHRARGRVGVRAGARAARPGLDGRTRRAPGRQATRPDPGRTLGRPPGRRSPYAACPAATPSSTPGVPRRRPRHRTTSAPASSNPTGTPWPW